MEFLTTVLAACFALGVIIFIHELGHLLVARAFDVRVLAFSLGFGKRIWGFERGETEYRLSLVPLGGYVKMGGESEEERTDDPRDFVNKPRWQRILVYLAGPAMNVVLALVLIAIVFMVGIDLPPRQMEPVVGLVLEDSAAAAAGLEAEDRILSIDGEAITDWQELQLAVISSAEEPMTLEVERAGEVFSTTMTPVLVPRFEIGDAGLIGLGRVKVANVSEGSAAAAAGLEEGDEILSMAGRPLATVQALGEFMREHPDEQIPLEILRRGDPMSVTVVPRGEKGSAVIGVRTTYGYFQRYPPMRAFVESFHYNVDIVRQTFTVLGKIFTREIKAKGALSGPLEIADMAGSQAREGFKYLLHLMGFISISIAIVNLLPIPILDGGQITILAVESILRRDLSLTFKERLAQVGFVLLMALMVTVIIFDIQKRIG